MYFSVIVPIYKVEPYLRECLDSLLAQTFTDFELILVDDGSPDGCPAICDEYAAKDARIKVLHKINGGLVSARQAGMEIAAGDYIVHVDSDDSVTPDYLEAAHEILEKENADVVAFAINYVTDGVAVYDAEPIATGLYDRARIEAEIFPEMLLTRDMKHMHYFVWGKVFRREAVYAHQMAIDPRIAMGEDVCCLIPTYLTANRVYVSDRAVYNCRCHGGSMSRKFNAMHYLDIQRGAELLRYVSNSAQVNAAIDRYQAFMAFVLLATAAETRDNETVKTVCGLWSAEFTSAFRNADFVGITPKSKIAFFLLRREKIHAAYTFLRLCGRLKGRTI